MRSFITGAGALVTAALALAVLPVEAQAATSSKVTAQEQPQVFVCRELTEQVPVRVEGRICEPFDRGPLFSPFIIQGSSGGPLYRCQQGFADTPLFVEGRYCEQIFT